MWAQLVVVVVVVAIEILQCYVRVEHLARLEQAGYDQVASLIVDKACALGTR